MPELLLADIGWHGQHYYDLPTEEDLTKVCLKIRQAYAKVGAGLARSQRSLVLVTHYPAFAPDPSDKQESLRTYACLRELASELKPIAIIQGHVHEWAGTVIEASIDGHKALVVVLGLLAASLRLPTAIQLGPERRLLVGLFIQQADFYVARPSASPILLPPE